MQPDRQFSVGEVLRGVTSSSGKLSIVATACVAVAMIIPVVSISGSVMGLGGGSTGVTWVGTAGVLAWLVLAAFAAAAAARYVAAMRAYSNVLDLAALGLFGLALVWAFIGGPAASGIGELNSQMASLGNLAGGRPGLMGRAGPSAPMVSISVLPSFGALFLAAAPVALFMAHRRTRQAVTAPVSP